jgi:hypothetical protein
VGRRLTAGVRRRNGSLEMTSWTNDDFERLGWHDNHVHGFAIREGQYGTGELILDIDYIVEWLQCSPGGSCNFRVAPATLTFHEMSDLQVALDYAGPTAGICPFSINVIERTSIATAEGVSRFRWRIEVNWPQGELSFHASGFTQSLRAPPIESSRQYLSLSEREALSKQGWDQL